MWGYRIYKGYKAVKNTAKLVKTTYKVAKKVKKLSSFKKSYKVVKAGKKAKRIVSKPKASKKLKKVENKSYKKSRVKTAKKYTKKKTSSSKGWKVGDPITKLTSKGTKPKWSTVRSRYWKNEAEFRSKNYTDAQLKRMRTGRAPQRTNRKTGKLESMELHHKIARKKRGTHAKANLKKVWPEEHSRIDGYRRLGGKR